MHDLPGAQEFDDIVDIRVVTEPQDVVIGDAGLLLRRQVLGQIGDQVALDRHGRRVPREAGGCGGIDTGGVIHKVGVEAGGLDVLLRQIAGQLVDDGADHLQMPQLLRADVREQALQLRVGHGVALAQITQGCAQLPVRTAVLGNDQRRQSGVGVFDLHRVLQLLFIHKHQSFPPLSQGHGSSSQRKPPSVIAVLHSGPLASSYRARPSRPSRM